ncbi:MAG TPA: LuxR C-terminal-related transcriptional regulator [Ktedonosporobacter sp.]|nr:LuxR C-terminal-related transcriptional regulator [Ktedonosporobacter sp.]
MARTTPRVEQGVLVSPVARNGPVAVGSEQWFSWLSDDENVSFFFANETGSFTARKERRKRGGWYWIAYRSRGGRLAKTYIGRSEDLTAERLDEIPCLLSNQGMPQRNPLSMSPLLATKFAPPPLSARISRILSRGKLLERLSDSLHVKLTLVTAPAGFGKTTLLSMWYEAQRRQRHKDNEMIWISLDERDNEPTRFWSSVWSTLRGGSARDNLAPLGDPSERLDESGGIDFAVPLYQAPQMTLETVMAVLLNGISKSRRHMIVILDDYHEITNPQIHEGMGFLLAYLPPSVHIILSSRSEPPLSLGRARVYGEIVELRADDLRLNEDEIEQFFRETIGISLSGEERAVLEERTEGWIAGLYLAGLALRGQQRPEQVLERFTGSQRSLFDYFAEEVFARQPSGVQRFLLFTAQLAELTPSLCAAVLGAQEWDERDRSVQRMFDYIEQANLFVVPLDEQGQRYRYHALFGEFLRERLKQSMPELLPELQQRASNWYERQGMIEEAIEYALSAQDTKRARRLIEHIGEETLWRKGEVQRLLTWMQQLPGIGNGESPQLEILYAWALLLSGQSNLEEVEALIEAIENRGEAEVTSGLRGDILALRARMAGFRNDIQGIAFARQALQELPKERALLRADVAFGLSGTPRDQDEAYRLLSEALHISQSLGSLRTAMFSARYLADTCREQGRLTEAEAILRQALHFAGVGESSQGTQRVRVPATGIVYTGLAELLYERNELVEALRYALLGVELGERSGEIKVLLYGYGILSLIFASKGEIERAWQELWKAERVASIGRVSWLGEQMAAIAVRLSLAKGDIQGAKRALQKREIDAEVGLEKALAVKLEDDRLMLARIWLAEEKYEAVVALLDPLIRKAREEKRVRATIIRQSLKAVALNGLRERRQAIQIVSDVLAIAEPEGYSRSILDLGEPMRDLLQRTELAGSARRYARKLLEATGVDNSLREQYGGLSEREYEVLQLVAAGMSNQEIANDLVVAPSTVKAHVSHLCQKLGVQKRIQAVAKAREMGLL